jgi:hypothetical protein
MNPFSKGTDVIYQDDPKQDGLSDPDYLALCGNNAEWEVGAITR